MKLIDYLNVVAQRTSSELTQKLVNNETVKDDLKRTFNLFHKDFNSRYNWPWRMKTTVFPTVPNYSAGSVSVSDGSRTVTGSGTAFTSDMVGRILKITGDSDFYEILAVGGATSLTLKTPYIGTPKSSSYIIWKKYYDLDPDVPYLSEISLASWPHDTKQIPKKTFKEEFSDPYLEGFPTNWVWGGINRTVSTYSTGTVTTTKDSRTLTGSATSWVGNVYAGSKITVGANVYNVESVDSDTQITMVQKAAVSVSASAYSIETKNRSQITLSSVPNPAANLYVDYFKQTFDLTNDEDEVEIWSGMEHIITSVMHGYFLEKLTSDKAFNWMTAYELQVNNAWKRLQISGAIDQIPRFQKRIVHGYRSALYG